MTYLGIGQLGVSFSGIGTDYGLDNQMIGVQIPVGARNFSLHHRVQTGPGPTQPPSQWVPGTPSVGASQPGREADHSPPSSADVKNAEICTSTPQYVFLEWCLVKHRDNFTFYV
jgi:hypothetical protein